MTDSTNLIRLVGEIIWDDTKPDGTPRKLMDSSKLNKLGWRSDIDLDSGIVNTYNWFVVNNLNIKEIKI